MGSWPRSRAGRRPGGLQPRHVGLVLGGDPRQRAPAAERVEPAVQVGALRRGQVGQHPGGDHAGDRPASARRPPPRSIRSSGVTRPAARADPSAARATAASRRRRRSPMSGHTQACSQRTASGSVTSTGLRSRPEPGTDHHRGRGQLVGGVGQRRPPGAVDLAGQPHRGVLGPDDHPAVAGRVGDLVAVDEQVEPGAASDLDQGQRPVEPLPHEPSGPGPAPPTGPPRWSGPGGCAACGRARRAARPPGPGGAATPRPRSGSRAVGHGLVGPGQVARRGHAAPCRARRRRTGWGRGCGGWPR